MKKFGKGINSIKPIMNYAIENMVDKNNIDEVLKCAFKMKEYLSYKL